MAYDSLCPKPEPFWDLAYPQWNSGLHLGVQETQPTTALGQRQRSSGWEWVSLSNRFRRTLDAAARFAHLRQFHRIVADRVLCHSCISEEL